MSPKPAHIIYQEILDRLTQALLRRDRKQWAEGMTIPHQLTTADGKLIHETMRDVEIGFTDYIGALSRLGVSHMRRTCKAAQETQPGCITGIHSTVMFGPNGEPMPEYDVSWTLHLGLDGQWRVAKADSAMSAEQWEAIPYNELTQFLREDTAYEMRLRSDVQKLVDRTDNAFERGDYEMWRQTYALPLAVETHDGTVFVETDERIKADFDTFRRLFELHNVTEFTRVIRTAELVSDTLMIATYRSHMLSGGRYVLPAWGGGLTLRKDGDHWRVTKVLNALSQAAWQHQGQAETQKTPEQRNPDSARVFHLHNTSSRSD